MIVWLKLLHLLAAISWMAGLLYFPRLLVYHCETSDRELFMVMERRLMQVIMTPAMVATWVLGLWLAYKGQYFAEPWFHGKVLMVVLLSGYHMWLAGQRRLFASGVMPYNARVYKIANEVPTVLLVGVLIFAVLRWPH